MAASNAPARPARAASRKWLIYSAIFGLLTVGCILVYRVVSGNTLRAQRMSMEAEKAEKALASKAPGNAEAFSALLAQRSKQAQEALATEQANAAKVKSNEAQPTGERPVMPLGVPKPPTGATPVAAPAGTTATLGAGGSSEIDTYAALKESQAREATRRMGTWERETRVTSTSLTDPTLLEPQDRAGNGNAAQEGGFNAATLLSGYLKSQAQHPSVQSSDDKFLAGAAKQDLAVPLTVQPGPGPHSVWEGTPIQIAMLTAVSSDINGPCRAQVVHDVYDSQTQSVRLIAAGTRLICVYNADVVQGQEKLNIAFTQMRFPNGAQVALSGMQGTDAQGVVGATAEVNSRFWKTFGSSFLVAALAKVAESSNQSAGVTINLTGAVGGAGAQVLSDIAKQSLQRNLQIKPELKLNLGERLNMVVTRDMVLDPQKTGVKQ
jgi:type IV secretory pathway VirB10-like protein